MKGELKRWTIRDEKKRESREREGSGNKRETKEEQVSKLVLHAQSTGAVISGRDQGGRNS